MHPTYLDEHGFDVVPLQTLVVRLRSGRPLPDKTAAITFDDGYRSLYDKARNIGYSNQLTKLVSAEWQILRSWSILPPRPAWKQRVRATC